MHRSKLLALALLTLTVPAFARSHTKAKKLGQLVVDEVELATVTPPKDNEICFSPDEPCHYKLKKFIESATKTLDVAIYDLNEDSIVHAILVKSKQIKVRVVVDKKQSKGNHSQVSLLQKAGVELRFGHQRGIMHDKFVITDGARLETGSFNYTHHAATANQENQVYLSTPEILSRYNARFNKMWLDSRAE